MLPATVRMSICTPCHLALQPAPIARLLSVPSAYLHSCTQNDIFFIFEMARLHSSMGCFAQHSGYQLQVNFKRLTAVIHDSEPVSPGHLACSNLTESLFTIGVL